jgi:hypothetical protein
MTGPTVRNEIFIDRVLAAGWRRPTSIYRPTAASSQSRSDPAK